MKLTPDDVKSIETVGHSDKGDILHVKLIGGLHMIVQKTKGGQLNVLAQAPHRGIAVHHASKIHKNIQWSESLNKSELATAQPHPAYESLMKQELRDEHGNPIHESNPQNHYDQAVYHSKKAGRHFADYNAKKTSNPEDQDAWYMPRAQGLSHSMDAINHYKMSGLNESDAKKEHQTHMQLHHELPIDAKPPFDSHHLELAWQRKHHKV